MYGSRPGVDRGQYSVMAYATWLCRFDDYEHAKSVVRWLLDCGLPEDIWVALALDDVGRFQCHLKQDPSLVSVRHPLFNMRIVEYVREEYLQILIAYGADVSDIFMAIKLGKSEDIKQRVKVDPELVGRVKKEEDGASVLMHALCYGQDDIACFLINSGADVNGVDFNGYHPLTMALIHDCPRAAKQLLASGVNPKHIGTSMLRLAIVNNQPHAEVIDRLLSAGLDPNADRIKGKTLLDYCLCKGHDEVAAILRRHGGRQRREID